MVVFPTLKLLQRSERSTGNGKTFPDSVRNPSASQITNNKTVILTRSIPLISFWTRTDYGTWIQQLLSHSTTLIIGSLCPVSTLRQQLTNLEHTYSRCYFHCKLWTVNGKDCASALHSFNKITYRTDEGRKQLLRFKNWVISGSQEQWMEFHHLYWTVVVYNCSYLF